MTKNANINTKDNYIVKVLLEYDDKSIDITNKVQSVPEINIELNTTTNIVQSNPFVLTFDNTDKYFYDSKNKTGIFYNDKLFIIKILIAKTIFNNYESNNEAKIIFKGIINNSSITIIEDDIVQCTVFDYFQYVLDQRFANRKYTTLYGGRPDIDIKKALNSLNIDYVFTQETTTEPWLKNIISTIETRDNEVEAIKDFWQTKTFFVNNEYLTGFVLLINDKIWGGFFNETTKELTINAAFDFPNVSPLIFDGVGKDKVHATYNSNNANCHFYVGTLDVDYQLQFTDKVQQDYNGVQHLNRSGYFANDSHFYHKYLYPLIDIAKMKIDFDFYNKQIKIYPSQKWGFNLGWRRFTASDNNRYLLFPTSITICQEDSSVKFFGTILNDNIKDSGVSVVNILAVNSGDNFIVEAGYDQNNLSGDYFNQYFSFVPPIIINQDRGIFFGNRYFVNNIFVNEPCNNATTAPTCLVQKKNYLFNLETFSSTGLYQGAPIGGDILYTGTASNKDYYLLLVHYLWGMCENGDKDFALYSIIVDHNTDSAGMHFIKEGVGLFSGLRHSSNKDNTNSSPCFYYTGRNGGVTVEVYEKIPSSNDTHSMLDSKSFYTQPHSCGKWILSKDVSYSSFNDYLYYFQNYYRSSGTKDKILNTVVYNDSNYNIFRFLSDNDQNVFYPQYNEVVLFNNVGDLLTHFCLTNGVCSFYDYNTDTIHFKNYEDIREEIVIDDNFYTVDIIPFYSRNFKKVKINKNNFCSISAGSIDNFSSELNVKSELNLISSIYSAIKMRKQNCYQKISKIYKISGLVENANVLDKIGDDKILSIKYNLSQNKTELKTETGFDNFVFYDFHDYNTFKEFTSTNFSVNANNIDYTKYLYLYGGAYSTASNGYLEMIDFNFGSPLGKTFKIIAIDINCDDGISLYMRPYQDTSYLFNTNGNTNVVNIENDKYFDLKIQANNSNLYVYFVRIYGRIEK